MNHEEEHIFPPQEYYRRNIIIDYYLSDYRSINIYNIVYFYNWFNYLREKKNSYAHACVCVCALHFRETKFYRGDLKA